MAPAPARDRDDQEQVVLGAKPPQDVRQSPRGNDRQHGEDRQPGNRGPGRAVGRAEDCQQNDGQPDAGHVLEHAPAEQRLLGLAGRRPSPAAGDVDDDHAGRERHAKPEGAGAEGRQARGESRAGRDRARDQGLERRRPQDLAVFLSKPTHIDLDPDLEQEQDHADIGQQLQLLVVGDVAGRERRDEEADREVADDRRQPHAAGQPTGERRQEKEHPDLEDRQRRGFHGPMLAGVDGVRPRDGPSERPNLRVSSARSGPSRACPPSRPKGGPATDIAQARPSQVAAP